MNLPALNWPLALGALLPWASLTMAGLLTPKLTRPDLFFSVTVKPNFRQSPAALDILRRYNRSVLAVAVMAILLMGLIRLGKTPLALLGLIGPVYLELAGLFVAFLVARRRALPFHVEPTGEREAGLVPRAVSTPVGRLAQAGPFLILAVVIFLIYTNWNDIPARIPMHWGASGAPNGWASKSVASVFGCAAMGVLVCSLLAAVRYAILHGVRRIHGSGARGQQEQRFVRAFSFFLLALEYWLALLLGSFSLVALRKNPATPLPTILPMMAGEILIIGTAFFLAWRTGQGGWRLGGAHEKEISAQDAPIGDRTPDNCWKLGVFYCNPNDPALFVEKRFGVGWTINMSNPKAPFIFVAVLLFVGVSLTVGLLAAK